jgi:hypothetical protein
VAETARPNRTSPTTAAVIVASIERPIANGTPINAVAVTSSSAACSEKETLPRNMLTEGTYEIGKIV